EEDAVEDYLFCLRKVYAYADYVAINISSPNTVGLRNLQGVERLKPFLARLKDEQLKLASDVGKYVPLVVKLSPDVQKEGFSEIADVLVECEIDGVIATNTTVSRSGVEDSSVS